MTAAFGLVLYLTYSGEGGSSPSATSPSPFAGRPTETASPNVTPGITPAPSPLPQVVQDSGLTKLEMSSLVQFPRDMSLILETGCWQCGGPPTGLRRMYKDADGELRIEQLLSIEALEIAPRIAETPQGTRELPPFITGLAVAPDASEMLVSICVDGLCEALPHAGPAEGRVAIFESADGGVTWHELGHDYAPTLSMQGYIAPSVALVLQIDPDTLRRLYYRFPGFEPLEHQNGHIPIGSVSGDVIWATKSGPLTYGSGEPVLDLGPDMFAGTRTVMYSPYGLAPFTWFWDLPGFGEPRHFLSLLNPVGGVMETYETSPVSNNMLTAIWLPDGRVAGTMAVDREQILGAPSNYIGHLPALLGLDSHRYNLIGEPFLEDDFEPERDVVNAVQIGPFARVIDTGSCLNIRESPGLYSTVLTCAADDVLLRTNGPAYAGDDNNWRFVTAPDGTSGWAATTFLEY